MGGNWVVSSIPESLEQAKLGLQMSMDFRDQV